MNKHRYPGPDDYSLRLREVVPERRIRLPEPRGPRQPYPAEGPYPAERPATEEDAVDALTWPQDTGWRHH